MLDGLIGDGGDSTLQQRTGQRRFGGKVQVGKKDHVPAQQRVLRRQRLLNFEHQRSIPCGGRIWHDSRTGSAVLRVFEATAGARAGFYADRMAGPYELFDPVRGDGHAVLAVLGRARNADVHVSRPQQPLSERGRPPACCTVCLRLVFVA
jgi:hypothetical protein